MEENKILPWKYNRLFLPIDRQIQYFYMVLLFIFNTMETWLLWIHVPGISLKYKNKNEFQGVFLCSFKTAEAKLLLDQKATVKTHQESVIPNSSPTASSFTSTSSALIYLFLFNLGTHQSHVYLLFYWRS